EVVPAEVAGDLEGSGEDGAAVAGMRLDDLPRPARIEQVLEALRRLLPLHQPGVVADDAQPDAPAGEEAVRVLLFLRIVERDVLGNVCRGHPLPAAGCAASALWPKSGTASEVAARPFRTWRLETRCLRMIVTSQSGKKRPAAPSGQGHPDGRARGEALLRRGGDAQVRPSPGLHHVIAGAAEKDVAHHRRLDGVGRRRLRGGAGNVDVMLADRDGGVGAGGE